MGGLSSRLGLPARPLPNSTGWQGTVEDRVQCMLEDLGCGDNKYLREGNFGPIDTDEIESSFASVVYLVKLDQLHP